MFSCCNFGVTSFISTRKRARCNLKKFYAHSHLVAEISETFTDAKRKFVETLECYVPLLKQTVFIIICEKISPACAKDRPGIIEKFQNLTDLLPEMLLSRLVQLRRERDVSRNDDTIQCIRRKKTRACNWRRRDKQQLEKCRRSSNDNRK